MSTDDPNEETVELQEFTCPTCGSHTFGTGGGYGVCHGYQSAQPAGRHESTTPLPCTFTWLRSEAEDAKVFKGSGFFHPRIATGVVVSRPGT